MGEVNFFFLLHIDIIPLYDFVLFHGQNKIQNKSILQVIANWIAIFLSLFSLSLSLPLSLSLSLSSWKGDWDKGKKVWKKEREREYTLEKNDQWPYLLLDEGEIYFGIVAILLSNSSFHMA